MSDPVPMAYFAHPIDQGGLDQALLDQTRSVLVHAGCTIYDPGHAWSGAISGRIFHANLEVLRQCDLLVAVLDPQRLSIGTVLEMVHHPTSSIVVYGPNLSPSVALEALHITLTTDLIQLAHEVGEILRGKGLPDGTTHPV